MKKTFIVLLSIFQLSTFNFQLSSASAQTPTLSDSAFASLITCGEGNDYYLSWGHSAIRVCDSARGVDYAYNYGTFDFDTPHFYWKFACGDLDYCLSRTRFNRFLDVYVFEGRAVWEQRLLLSPQEVNNLFLLLETNYLPEYRYYRYDFFRDNCATRVRDIVAAALDHRILSPETAGDRKTYRDYLYEPTERTRLWWRLGVDITLGLRCDHPCTNYEAMFSPIVMMHTFDTMTVTVNSSSKLGDEHKLQWSFAQRGGGVCHPAVQLLPDVREPLSPSIPPTLVFWGIFVIAAVLTVLEWKKGWRLTALDRTLYIAAALISVVIIFLWFFTSHYCTKFNLNILWASPLFILFSIFPSKRKIRSSVARLLWQCLAILQNLMLLAALLFCFYPHPQRLNIALCPVVLTLLLRLLFSLYRPDNK